MDKTDITPSSGSTHIDHENMLWKNFFICQFQRYEQKISMKNEKIEEFVLGIFLGVVMLKTASIFPRIFYTLLLSSALRKASKLFEKLLNSSKSFHLFLINILFSSKFF
jgi:hypothetical protein